MSTKEMENIFLITDRDLRNSLEYTAEDGIAVKIVDRDRFVLTIDKEEIRPEQFKKFGFYVKRVKINDKYGAFAGVEVFFER